MSGIFGITMDGDCSRELEQGAPILQPRGDEWAGISFSRDNRIRQIFPRKGKIAILLSQQLPKIKGAQTAIAHMSQKDPQPETIDETKMGPISLIFDGKITNRTEIHEKFPHLVGTDPEILVRLVASEDNPVDGLRNIFEYVKGPFSVVLLTKENIFAARDILGIRPMIIGRFTGDEKIGCAVASESSALEHIGMEIIRDIRPGEIVSIETTGFKTIEQIASPGLIICGFEYGYWARPSSIIENIDVGLSRYIAGIKLAENFPEVDIVSGFPMSGDMVAQGIAYALGIPYRRIFDVNFEAGGRSFLPFSSEDRGKRAKGKLLIMKWAVQWGNGQRKGLRIAIGDDSIVEGNQTLARIFLIKNAGAKEVHLRIETPEMKHHCPFDVTPRGELMAATHTKDDMRKKLGVETLGFNSVENFTDSVIEAGQEGCILKKNNLCTGCFTGQFPEY